MTREQGLKQIDEAQWKRGDTELTLTVNNQQGRVILAWLRMRPHYCDRGHIQLLIDGPLELDNADSFPRYFFSFEEADQHTRTFLKWRLWKQRVHPDAAIRKEFEVGPHAEFNSDGA